MMIDNKNGNMNINNQTNSKSKIEPKISKLMSNKTKIVKNDKNTVQPQLYKIKKNSIQNDNNAHTKQKLEETSQHKQQINKDNPCTSTFLYIYIQK